jgi:hypothetical protein
MTSPSEEYAILLSSVVEPASAVRLYLPEGTGVDQAAEAVDGLLAADATVEAISLVVGGKQVGLTSRSFFRIEPDSGGQRSFGAGEGGVLPGESLRYVPVRYLCGTAGCGHKVFRAFYDEADVPVCDTCGGPMELAR